MTTERKPPAKAEIKAMSGVDAAWLHMEESTNLMMVTGVLLLDTPPDMARFRKTIEERLLPLDRFTMLPVAGRTPMSMPHWESDPNFDVDAHLHRIALPAPGGEAELRTLLSDLASTPLDMSKPLWQMHIVENVLGGGAMILRFHHAVGDGASMNYVMYQLMDTSRDPAARPATPELNEAPIEERGLLRSIFRPVTGAVGLSRKTVGLLHEGLDSILHPSRLLEQAGAATDRATVLGRMLLLPSDPPTPFKGALGVQKRVAWSDPLPLSDVKLVADALGAKINDLLMSALAGALRIYLEEEQAEIPDQNIHVVVPVDLRPPERAYELGNNFGLVFVGLPLNMADPQARLDAVRGRMNAIKESPEANVFFNLLSITGHTPTGIEEQIVNIFGARATAVLTNVAGPRKTLYLAGSRIEHIMFWVPQSGHLGMGISILSYDGEILVGIITDAGLVADPTKITKAFNQEFSALLNLAQQDAHQQE